MTDYETVDDAAMVEALLRAIPTTRSVYRERLRSQLAHAATARTKRRHSDLRRSGGWAVAGAIMAVVLGVSLLLSPHAATPASAYSILRAVSSDAYSLPYTGTSTVSYQTPWHDDFPVQVPVASSQHQATVDWSVRDALHFRVDIHVILPSLESGVKTVVVNGSGILSYDHRSGKAWTATIPQQDLAWAKVHLLTILQSGASEGPVAEADPSQTVQTFLARKQQEKSRFGGFARLVGQTTVLGHAADIIDFGPVFTTSCSDPSGQPDSATGQVTCAGGHGEGWARVWVDHSHPFILRYEEHGLGSQEAAGTTRSDFVYQATSVSFGQGPSDAALQYRPPMPAVDTANAWRVYPDAGQTSTGATLPAPFIPTVCPGNVATGTWCHADWSTTYGDGPLTQPIQADTLYVEGSAALAGNAPSIGPTSVPLVPETYVLVQERVRLDGLSSALQVGPTEDASGCQAWSGSYANGQRWTAFAKGDISVLISSNSLSQSQLVRYAGQICTP